MDAREYLSEIKKLEKMISRRKEDMERWYTIATNITPQLSPDRVQTSGNQQKIESAVVQYLTIERELFNDIVRLEKERTDRIQILELLPFDEYEILYMVYVLYRDYDSIATEKGKSKRWAAETCKKGVKMVQEILDRRKDGERKIEHN